MSASVDGKWVITIKSPIGPQVTTLELKNTDGVLTGTSTGMGNTTELSEGKVDGNTLTWVNNTTVPMKMKLVFTGTIEGTQISGKVKAGIMGTFTFAGAKQA